MRGVRKLATSSAAGNPNTNSEKASPEDLATRAYLRRFTQRYGELPPHLNALDRGEGSGFVVRADGVILTNAQIFSLSDGYQQGVSSAIPVGVAVQAVDHARLAADRAARSAALLLLRDGDRIFVPLRLATAPTL